MFSKYVVSNFLFYLSHIVITLNESEKLEILETKTGIY